MSGEKLPWSVAVDSYYPEGVSLHPQIRKRIRQEMPSGGFLFFIDMNERKMQFNFGVLGDSEDEARHEGEEIIKTALGNLGLNWSGIECVRIIPLEEIYIEADKRKAEVEAMSPAEKAELFDQARQAARELGFPEDLLY